MMLTGTQSDLEQRFGHLLQPIRDLTKNWDIDICSYLEDYLEELDKIHVTFDDGHTTMNFAEAALLIQGSACVYSKKVEYLYTLVYQVLDLLANKKRHQQPSSVDKDGNDNDANFPNNVDEEFLSLDNIKEHKNVDMKEAGDTLDKSVLPIPKTPLSLIPLEEGEKGQNPLISKTGEVLASRNDFKMNTSFVHPCGSLLLDMTHLNLLELSLKLLASSTPFPMKQAESKHPAEINGNIQKPAEALNMAGDDVAEPDNMVVNMSVSFEENNMPDDAAPDNFEDDPLAAPPLTMEEEPLRRSERRKVQIAVAQKTKEVIDPWLECDPYEENKSKIKVLSKKKRSVRIPAKLQEPGKQKRKRGPVVELTLEPLVCRDHCKDQSKKKLKDTLSEFEAYYWEEYTKRKAQEKEERRLMMKAGYQVEEEEEVEPAEEVADIEGCALDDVEEDDNFRPLEIDEDMILGADNPLHHRNSIDLDDSMYDNDHMVNSYEILVRKHVEAFMASAQEYAQITELSKRVSEWEDKIVPKLREEEQHEPFDIHRYGSTVIGGLDKGQKILFKKLVAGKPDFEICRLFLATLQLANVGNVAISCDGELHEGMDKMALELLSTKRHFEELAEYQAPSAK